MMNKSLHLAAVLGLVAGMNPAVCYGDAREHGAYDQKPINTGRRAEKDAEALRKAQAKRDMKNAKRIGATKG